MYNIRISAQELEAVQRGHTPTILQLLERSNQVIIKELKTPGSNVPFLQGVAHVTDKLIKVLTTAI